MNSRLYLYIDVTRGIKLSSEYSGVSKHTRIRFNQKGRRLF